MPSRSLLYVCCLLSLLPPLLPAAHPSKHESAQRLVGDGWGAVCLYANARKKDGVGYPQ